MSDTPQPFEPPETPVERSRGNEAPTNGDATKGDGTSLKDRYDDYLVRCDMALRDGEPLPPLPAELAATPFAPQAASGVRLLKLLARARDTVMGTPAPELGAALLERVGPFRLVRELGRGGHGVVYLAVDERLGRQVALKLSRPETLLDADLRKRFLREAQAAGQLDHPQLVPVHEVGEEGRLFYIASQYVEGKDLAQWLAEQTAPVPPRQAAELVAALADGVEHAHAHGILHRDIKPSNVLLSEEGGRLSPRLTDFGLAKLLEATKDQTQTRTGVLLGTPTYMAPELATGKLREVGPATDAYGLGALLYEILTGRPPFRGENDVDTIHQAVHEEPLDPRRLRPGVSPELAAICLKCLEKRPEARYATAGELAADLRRYLSGQPTLARPATPLDRLQKWARRRPAVASLSGALAATALVMVVGGLWLGLRLSRSLSDLTVANRGLESTNRQLGETNQQLMSANALLQEADRANKGRELAAATNSAQGHLLNNNAPQAQAVLDRYLAAHPTATLDYSFRWVRRVVSGEDYHTQETDGTTYALAASHDGRMFATGGEDGTVRLWRASDGVRLHEFEFPHTLSIYSLAFSPGDDLILSAGGDLKRSEVILWDVPAKIRRMDFEGPPLTANAVAFSPDGNLMAVAGSGRASDSGNPVAEIRVWEIDLAQRSAPAASVKQWFSPPRVWQSAAWNSANALAFTADSRTLVVGYGLETKGAVGLWEVKSGKEEVVLPAVSPVWAVSFAGQGRRLVAGDRLGGVAAWSYPERKELGRGVVREGAWVMSLAPAASGSHVFAATTYSHEGKPRFDVTQWDVTGGPELVAALADASGECRALAALPDGISLLSAGTGGLARRWNIQRHTLWNCLPTFHGSYELVLSPEATHAAVLWEEGDFVIYRLSDGARRNLFAKHANVVATFGRSHEEVFTSGEDGIVMRHFLEEGAAPRFEELTRHGRHPFRDDTGNQNSAVRELDYAPGPRRLASCGNDGRVQVWDLDKKRLLFETPDQGDRVRDVRFSRDGSLVAAAVANRWARVWRANSGELVHESKHSEELWSVAIAPDNLQLAVGGDQGTLWLHDLRTTGDEPRELLQGRGEVDSLDYSPDGRTLAAVDRTRTIRLWEPTSGASLLEAPHFGGGTGRLRFTRDGTTLVADVGGRLVMWSAERSPPPSEPPASAAELRNAMSSASAAATASPTAYAARVRRAWNRYVGDNLDNAESMLDEAGYALPSKVARPFEMGFLYRQSKREELWARGSGGSSEGTATSLALSADARLGAIGTQTGHITSMDPYSNQERRIFELGAPIVDLAVARDRARLFVATAVSGTAPFALKTLTLSDGKAVDLGGTWGQISAIATSQDGRWLVAGGWDGTPGEVRVRRFDLQAGLAEAPPLVIKSRNGDHESATPIQALAFSPDSRTLAVGHGNPAWRGSHGMVTFWDLESGTEASARFTGFDNFVQSLAFSPDGAMVAAGSRDGTLRLWDVPGQRPIATLPGEGGPIQRVAFSRDGQFVATGSAFLEGAEKPGELLLWDVAQRTLASCLARFPRGIYGLAFHPDGEMLVVLTAERALRAIPYRKREVYQRIPAHEGAVQALEFDSSGRLFTAGRDRSLRSWDLESRSPISSIEIGQNALRGVALAADGKILLTFGERPELAWRDSNSGSVLRRSDPLPDELSWATMSAGGAVAAADVAGGLHRWDADGKRTLSWTAPSGPVRQLLFTDDLGRMAASACADKVVFWDTHSGNYRNVLDAGSEVRSLALSPDRKLVAAGTAQGAIRLWSVESGKLVAAIREHTAPVAALTFSTDGQTLASSAGPGEIWLWNVPTLEKLFPLDCPSVQVNVLRFSPGNRRLVAGMADGALVVWRASEEE